MHEPNRMKLQSGTSVVVPVYNSAPFLLDLANELEPILASLELPFELILVNDGSRDDSWTMVEQLAAKNDWIRGFNLMRNYGQHNALLCGIREAKYACTVTMDDDLQNPPEEIPRILSKLKEGFDVVYGVPLIQQHGLLRDLASETTKIVLSNAMGAEIARNVSAFRAFRTHVRDAFRNYQGPWVSIDVLLTWGTTRFGALPVRHDPRREGTSGYTVGKLIRHALNMITGFSTLPLQIASMIGFACALFGLFLLSFVLARYFFRGGSIPGFPFLASMIAIFSGTQMFTIGIIGEYLGRVHLRTMDRPAYTVRISTHDIR
jgi:glycosyltransferase involved in cell wall biosynthesis